MKISNRIKKNIRRKLAAAFVAGMMSFGLCAGSVDAAEVLNIKRLLIFTGEVRAAIRASVSQNRPRARGRVEARRRRGRRPETEICLARLRIITASNA